MAPLATYSPYSIDFWKNDYPERLELTCLMPNGIYIELFALSTATIKEIKTDLIRESKNYPLNNLIKDACDYEISGITAFANVDPFTDETKRLCDVQPYFCILSVGERTESTSNASDYELHKMIGKPFEDQQVKPEIKDFRIKMTQMCERIEAERARFSWIENLLYVYPMRLSESPRMPELIKQKLGKTRFLVSGQLENNENSYTVSVEECQTVKEVTENLVKRSKHTNQKCYLPEEYILKVRGQEEYFYGDYPLIQFIYIQERLSDAAVPTVVLKHIASLPTYKQEMNNAHNKRAPLQQHTSITALPNKPLPQIPKRAPKEYISWEVNEPFRLRLHNVENVNYDTGRAVQVGVNIGLYHGERKLGGHHSVTVTLSSTNRSFIFDKDLSFDTKVENLPRMTHLCIVIYEVTKSSSRSKKSSSNTNKENIVNNVNPLAWVNTTIFDYQLQLRTGWIQLNTWTYADDVQSISMFHPLGTIESNPSNDSAKVQLTFHDYGCGNIYYPTEDIVLHNAAILEEQNAHKRGQTLEGPVKPLRELLAPCMRVDRLYEMHDLDRNAIWARRAEILVQVPEELPILLHCVNWNERNDVSEMWSLLKHWPTLPVERSLELLDYAYPDPAVRKFAVNCLRVVSDEELLLYLLQLVQALKHESYLDCDLATFVLERALHNQRIGHYFFWHLKSEMQTPSVQTRFALLLEAYLKGSKPHVPILRKQLNALEKLKQGSELAKKGNKEKVRSVLQDFLANSSTSEAFQNVQNPLNPSFRCKGVLPEQCKVMDSKMRPLWIVFKNADVKCNDIYIIFKNGDDLRQDMLTLQMLRVMDTLWKKEGMDLRMNIYNCISMERRLGMIEVVLNAETIANIQKEKGMFSATSPFKKGSLLSWLKEHNKSDDELNQAINEFTYSCAGYCVATYVLGVADRHSDNIMVKRNGQLFHVDFGHILGHFKEKFGVRRERVPFVLTHDFVYVINKGRADRELEEFRKFQTVCEKAFLVLRKHGCLILSLFSLMISTGLPELSSEKDLSYLKETLVLEYTEEKAREHFRSKFSEALANSWKTSLNWASHNFSKNNKQ